MRFFSGVRRERRVDDLVFDDAIRISIFQRFEHFQRYADFAQLRISSWELSWCSIFKILILEASQVSEVLQVSKIALKIARPFVLTFRLFEILLLLSDRTKRS